MLRVFGIWRCSERRTHENFRRASTDVNVRDVYSRTFNAHTGTDEISKRITEKVIVFNFSQFNDYFS
ncbi:MAG: hypothetical protein FWG67_04705 [Defluviitaleaceae bacterium]|nr:hypothetical protein [Defluviitaleaceae bacterium]